MTKKIGHLQRGVQWNVSYPNILGLNPVCSSEYSVSLKLGKAHVYHAHIEWIFTHIIYNCELILHLNMYSTYKTVIAHGLGLPQEYNYLILALPWPHIIFWQRSFPLGYNSYINHQQSGVCNIYQQHQRRKLPSLVYRYI